MKGSTIQSLITEYGYDNLIFVEYDGNIFTRPERYKHVFDHTNELLHLIDIIGDSFTRNGGQVDVRQYSSIYTLSFLDKGKAKVFREAEIDPITGNEDGSSYTEPPPATGGSDCSECLVIHPNLEGFATRWDTRNTSLGSTDSFSIKLPLLDTGTYDFIVNWGDDTFQKVTNWKNSTHVYDVEGIKTITITGSLTGWSFNGTGDRLKLLEIL